jgi:type IV protein arginine methyltransferase
MDVEDQSIHVTNEPDSTTTTRHDDMDEEEEISMGDPTIITAMMEACRTGNETHVRELLTSTSLSYAAWQDTTTGQSPLMMAAARGHASMCQVLLDAGAPWNAVDRQGQCAGDYATHAEQWNVVQLLVNWGVRAELILGRIAQSQWEAARAVQNGSGETTHSTSSRNATIPVEHEPSTKPDYLQHRLHYTADGQALVDADEDAVMMQWEQPLMEAHAQILMNPIVTDGVLQTMNDTMQSAAAARRRVLNVGFGMGLIDTALQAHQPAHHIIVEAHPDVYQKMIQTGWDQKPNVRICFGTWQDVIPQLVQEGVVVDSVFYDTVCIWKNIYTYVLLYFYLFTG